MRPKHRTVRFPESVEDPRDDVEVGALHLGHTSPREDSPQLRLDRRPALFPAPPVPVVLTLDVADPMPYEPYLPGREGLPKAARNARHSHGRPAPRIARKGRKLAP